jgi:hypothetical protein
MADSWDEYRRLVLSELDRIDNAIDSESRTRAIAVEAIENKIAHARESIVALQVKAGIWGAIGGILAGVAGLLAKIT